MKFPLYFFFLVIVMLHYRNAAVISQNAPVSTIEAGQPCPDNLTQVTLPVTVTGFTQISAFNLRIDYNPQVLVWVTSVNKNPNLPGLLVIDNHVSDTLHKIIAVWSSIYGQTLADGSTLFGMKFTFLEGASQVNFNNTSVGGSECEYSDYQAIVLNDTPTSSFYHNNQVKGKPKAAGTITGSSQVCQGETSVVYHTVPISNATGYVWNLPPGASISGGAGTNNITVNFSSSAQSGVMTVYGTNECGNRTSSPGFQVIVGTLPSGNLILDDTIIGPNQEICARAQNITLAGNGSQFLVQNGGQAILIASQKILMLSGTIVNSGGYLKALVNNHCLECSSFLLPATQPGLPDPGLSLKSQVLLEKTAGVSIYPNPTDGTFP